MNTPKIYVSKMCITGLVRTNNEDNLWADGQALPENHKDLAPESTVFSPERPVWYAVFDGMGGEQRGETASFLAASAFGDAVNAVSASGCTTGTPGGTAGSSSFWLPTDDFMRQLCLTMNTAVAGYAKNMNIRTMGTTAVAFCFSGNTMRGFNVGDSRAYRMRDGRLEQISCDHVTRSLLTGQDYLAQCIGMRQEKCPPMPTIFESDLRPGDQFLLVSDGVNNMIHYPGISAVLSESGTTGEKMEKLRQAVLSAGALDNATAILIEMTD